MFVKNLRSDVENPEARHVHSWIEEGLFDAINKQYLKALILSIHDFDSDSLLECYQYRFDYSAGLNVELDRTQIDQPLSSASIISNSNRTSQMNNDSVITKEEAKSQTTKLLQGLIALTQTLGPLPDKRYLSMRLAYYDERVPQDYNPPHFHAIPDPKTSTDSKTTKNNVQGADLNLSTDKASGKIIGSQKLKMPSVANLTLQKVLMSKNSILADLPQGIMRWASKFALPRSLLRVRKRWKTMTKKVWKQFAISCCSFLQVHKEELAFKCYVKHLKLKNLLCAQL